MTALRVLRFMVPGTPVPQGSKSAFVVKGRAIIAESNRAKLKPYRATVAEAASAAMNGGELWSGPIRLTLVLTFPRPKAHYRKGSLAGLLRPLAPFWVTTRPDASKVVRAIEDALTGIVYRDDSQVCVLDVRKVYGDPPSAAVGVELLADPIGPTTSGAVE